MFRILLAAAALALAAGPAGAVDSHHAIQRNAWYLPVHDPDARLFVTSLGQGPKVVVLHGGWGANLDYMVGAVEPHEGRHEFVLYDQRGSLRSPVRPGDLDKLDVGDLVDELELLRTALGEDKLTIFAHSMGTRLAIEYASRYPDHVARLVLAGAFQPRSPQDDAAFWKTSNGLAYAMMDRPEVLAEIHKAGLWPLYEKIKAAEARLKADPGDGSAARALEAEVPPRDASRLQKLRFASVNMFRVERWREMEGGEIYYSGAAGGRLAETAPRSWDLPAALGARAVPITVIQGDHDYVEPSATSWTALKASGSPLGRCVHVAVIRDAGHASWMDDPKAFAAALEQGLDRNGCG
jgi:pimeloyl-ACP methyl ester carboxylesterase